MQNHISTKIDMHFHTKMSDGAEDNDYILEQAKKKWLTCVIATDHDIINEDFYRKAKKIWLDTCYWVEINAMDHEWKYLHILAYSNWFSRDIYDILENNREWKINRLMAQIIQIEEHGFEITAENFFWYYKNLWINPGNLNNYHLSNYILKNEYNVDRLKNVFKINLWEIDFIKDCLKKDWKYSFLWYVEQEPYLPTLRHLWEAFSTTDTVLSLAHPNFSFNYTGELNKKLERYVADWLNAIEINALATKTWVHTILHATRDYNLLTTFWSDSHFKKPPSRFHWDFWELNHYLDIPLLRRELKKLIKALR